MRLGLIGFGEAGYAIAKSLEDALPLSTFDAALSDAERGPLIRERAEETGTVLVGSASDLAAQSDIVLSLVVSDAAISVASAVAPYLSPRHLYADLNSASPATKQQVAEALAGSGCRFADVAVMAAVPPLGHRVPMLAAGPGAEALATELGPFGFAIEAIEGEVGAASAVKMFRSVLMKGMGSLVLECAQAANRYGATDRVFASAGESMGMDIRAFADHIGPRQLQHAARRVHEMAEVAATLRDCGVEPWMSEACATQLKSFVERGLPAKTAGGASLADALRLMRDA